MKKRLCVIALSAALLGTTSIISVPQQAGAQSLEDEIAHLLVNHPQIRAARKNVAASAEGVNAAFAQYLPTISAFSDFGYERIDSPGRTSATPDQGPFTTGQARQTSVTLTQTLFNGYLNDSNNTNAELTKKASEITLEETQQSILFEGVSIYLTVLRDLRLLKLAGENEATIQRQFELEDERVKRGAGITLDVLESKKRLQVAKERRVAFEGALRDSFSRFNQVFGHEPVIDDMIMPTPPLGLVPDSVETAIAVSMDEHPAIRNSQTRIDIAQEQRTIAKAAFYPTIDIVAEWSYEDDLGATRGSRRDYTAKIQANWDLFNGFATRAGVAQASHNYLSSIDAGNFIKRKIAEEIRLAMSGFRTARDRVTLLQNAVNIAAEVFSGRRKLREAGKETVINVLDSESQLFDARIQLVSAQHDARVAVYRLLAAMSRLNLDTVSQYAAAPARRNVAAAEPRPEPKAEAQDEQNIASVEPLPEPKPEPSETATKAEPAPKPEAKLAPKKVTAKEPAAPVETAATEVEPPPAAETAQPVKVESIKQPDIPERRIASAEDTEHAKADAEPKKAITVKIATAEPASKVESKLASNDSAATSPIIKANYPVDGDPNFMRAWPYE